MRAAGEPNTRPPERLAALPPSNRLRRFIERASLWRPPSPQAMAGWLQDAFDAEAKARSAFFLIPIGLMIGIAITDGAGFRMGLLPALTLAVPLLGCAWHFGGRGLPGAGILVAAFVSAGMALALAELRWTETTIFSGEVTVRIEGRVAWRDRDERERMRYLVRIEKTERPVLSRPPELVSILVSNRHETIPVGGRFKGLVRLRAHSGPAYPGAYDFAFAPFFEGRGANGFSLGAPEPPGSEAIATTPGERLVRLRLAMSDRIRDVIGGGAGAVASALITGERSGIPDDINDWLRATGLSHVLSISGLHMALVAGFAMMLVRGLLAAVPGAALTLPTKKIAAVAALLVATGYLVISGSDVATDRSYVMLSIMLLAILVDRPALTLRNVAIAALVVMLTTPHAVVTASYQMSFSATAALVGVYGAASRHRARTAGDQTARPAIVAALVFLAGLAASSLIAGTATAPYAAYHFQRVAPYGVIANLIAVPIFSFWIMPLALIAALAMPFGLDAPFLILIGWALDLVFALAKVLAEHFPDAPSGRLTSTGLLVVTAALLLACFAASRLRWSAVPIALLGIAMLPDRSEPPDLLVFEDGRELATIDAAGRLYPLRRKPNDFVADQWKRAFETQAREPIPDSGKSRFASQSAGLQNLGAPSSETAGSLRDERSEIVKKEPNSNEATRESRRPTDPSPATQTISGTALSLTGAPGFTCEPSPLPTEDGATLSNRAVAKSSPAEGRRVGPESKPGSPAAPQNTENSERTSPSGSTLRMESSVKSRAVDRNVESRWNTLPAMESQSAGLIRSKPSADSTPVRKPPPQRQICRATTRSGISIAWTDDYRLVGLVCDTADVAVVARAIARRDCRSGARLVTLRTLRETGSLAISRDEATKKIAIAVSITDPNEPWNLHRRAPWPETWKNPDYRETIARPHPANAQPTTGDP